MPVTRFTTRYTGERKAYTFCDLLDETYKRSQVFTTGPLKIDEKTVKIVLRNDKVGVALFAYAEEPCEVDIPEWLIRHPLYELARGNADDFVAFSFCQTIKCGTSTTAHPSPHVVTVSWRFIRTPLAETSIDETALLWKNELDIPMCYLRTGYFRFENVIESLTGEKPKKNGRSKKSKKADTPTRQGKRPCLRPAKLRKDAHDTERKREEDAQMMEG